MRPRKLVIEGLRSYRQRQEITFTDGLFAITGQTGSGKSSILEALVFALYGTSTFDARNSKILLADRCDEMMVSLEFILRREHYQITRSFTASGKQSLHELRGPGGEILASKSSEVDKAVEELLGLRCEDFLKTVVLPQGAFQNLLHSTPTQRTPLLKNLLGLFQLDELAERVSTEKQRLGGLVQLGSGLRQQLPLQPEQLAQKLHQERQELVERQRLLEEHTAQITSISELQKQGQQNLREREQELASLRALRWPSPSQWAQLAQVESALILEEAQLQAQEAELHARQADLRHEEERRPELQPARLRAWERQHQGLLQRVALLQQAAASQLRDQQELGLLVELVEQLGLRVAEMSQHNQSLRLAVQQAQADLGEQEAEWARWQAVEARRANLHAHWERLQSQISTVETGASQESTLVSGKTVDCEGLRRSVAAQEQRLADQERRSGLQALCSDVHPGQLCPLCDRELPPDWHIPPSQGVEEARQALAEGQGRLRMAESALAQSLARADMLSQQLGRLQAEAAVNARERAELPADLSESLQGAGLRLKEAQQARQDLALRLAEGQTQEDMGRQNWSSEKGRLADLSQRLQHVQGKMAAEEAQVAGVQRSLCAELGVGQWPEEAASRLAALEVEMAAMETQRRAFQDQLHETQGRRQSLLSRRQLEFERPFEQLRGLLHTSRARLAAVQPTTGTEELDGLVEWRRAAQEWQASCERLAEELEERLTRQRIEFAQTQERLQELMRSWRSDEGGESMESYAASLARELEEKKRAVWELQHRLAQLDRDKQRLERLNTALLPAERRLIRLEAVHELLGNKSGKDRRLSFTQWVLQQRQERLLELASHTFQQISAGQFGFAPDFQILDMHSGLERKPATLSGGETFLASLSLALSLSELVARRGGRLEAFFIDEGFGSLSPECLDRALTALEVLAQSGRMIGVISHVPLMAERIEQVWVVSKTPNGSRIEILSEELRKRMLEADLRAFESANHPLFAPN